MNHFLTNPLFQQHHDKHLISLPTIQISPSAFYSRHQATQYLIHQSIPNTTTSTKSESNNVMLESDILLSALDGEEKRVFITGAPDSGKTLLLVHKCVQCTMDGSYVPFYISLKNDLKQRKSLIDSMMQSFGFDFLHMLESSPDRILLAFDDLEKLEKDEKQSLLIQIVQFANQYASVRMLVACGQGGFNRDLAIDVMNTFSVVRIMPLTFKHQMDMCNIVLGEKKQFLVNNVIELLKSCSLLRSDCSTVGMMNRLLQSVIYSHRINLTSRSSLKANNELVNMTLDSVFHGLIEYLLSFYEHDRSSALLRPKIEIIAYLKRFCFHNLYSNGLSSFNTFSSTPVSIVPEENDSRIRGKVNYDSVISELNNCIRVKRVPMLFRTSSDLIQFYDLPIQGYLAAKYAAEELERCLKFETSKRYLLRNTNQFLSEFVAQNSELFHTLWYRPVLFKMCQLLPFPVFVELAKFLLKYKLFSRYLLMRILLMRQENCILDQNEALFELLTDCRQNMNAMSQIAVSSEYHVINFHREETMYNLEILRDVICDTSRQHRFVIIGNCNDTIGKLLDHESHIVKLATHSQESFRTFLQFLLCCCKSIRRTDTRSDLYVPCTTLPQLLSLLLKEHYRALYKHEDLVTLCCHCISYFNKEEFIDFASKTIKQKQGMAAIRILSNFPTVDSKELTKAILSKLRLFLGSTHQIEEMLEDGSLVKLAGINEDIDSLLAGVIKCKPHYDQSLLANYYKLMHLIEKSDRRKDLLLHVLPKANDQDAIWQHQAVLLPYFPSIRDQSMAKDMTLETYSRFTVILIDGFTTERKIERGDIEVTCESDDEWSLLTANPTFFCLYLADRVQHLIELNILSVERIEEEKELLKVMAVMKAYFDAGYELMTHQIEQAFEMLVSSIDAMNKPNHLETLCDIFWLSKRSDPSNLKALNLFPANVLWSNNVGQLFELDERIHIFHACAKRDLTSETIRVCTDILLTDRSSHLPWIVDAIIEALAREPFVRNRSSFMADYMPTARLLALSSNEFKYLERYLAFQSITL